MNEKPKGSAGLKGKKKYNQVPVGWFDSRGIPTLDQGMKASTLQEVVPDVDLGNCSIAISMAMEIALNIRKLRLLEYFFCPEKVINLVLPQNLSALISYT